jgi:hypothetical protein
MAENKTQPTAESVMAFLNQIEDQQVRADCLVLLEMMQKASKCEPILWGSAIVGFGIRHYVYESGREGDTSVLAFSPRKQNLTLYLAGGVSNLEAELSKLGKYKTGKGCLYLKSLGDVDLDVLQSIFAKAFAEAQSKEKA